MIVCLKCNNKMAWTFITRKWMALTHTCNWTSLISFLVLATSSTFAMDCHNRIITGISGNISKCAVCSF